MSKPSLTAAQLRDAERLQRRGRLLREIAVELGVAYEAVCLGLYGGNARIDSQAKATRAEPAPAGMSPAPDGVASRPIRGGGTPAAIAPPPQSGRADAERELGASRDYPSDVTPEAVEQVRREAAPAIAAEEWVEVDSVARRAQDAVQAPLPAAPDEAAIDDERADLAKRFHAATRFNLRSSDGQWLHESLLVLTRMPKFYWRGTAEQIAAVKRRQPKWRALEPVPVK